MFQRPGKAIIFKSPASSFHVSDMYYYGITRLYLGFLWTRTFNWFHFENGKDSHIINYANDRDLEIYL